MLTDIFETRYANRRIWSAYTESERRFLVQAAKIITKQLFPVWTPEGKENEASKKVLQSVLDKVAMEVGIREFHPKYYSYTTKWNGKDVTSSGEWSLDRVYETVFGHSLSADQDPDSWMKRCISIVELAFRQKEAEIKLSNANLPLSIARLQGQRANKRPGIMTLPGDLGAALISVNKKLNNDFIENVAELNQRFQQSGFPVEYHNGFIQIKTDQLVSDTVEKPFWALVSGADWGNVDIDMKHALDLRDTGGRDPAFYAARALESTIKIISGKLGRSTGKEKGAANYLDNLVRDNGGRFIEVWEKDILTDFFRNIRNPLGHGPGDEKMVVLSTHQTDWAIEVCMSWIKALIRRLPS